MNKSLFPLTNKYNQSWIKEDPFYQSVLYYTEGLVEKMNLQKGMRVLDLGCGGAISSIFLAREFDVQVWAVDREVSPTENFVRIQKMECENKVFPLKADARSLPLPFEFFDAVISIDSFSYYATDDWYLPYFSQFIKKNGEIGISEWCYSREFRSINEVPDFLKECYLNLGFHGMHSLEWLKNHFEKAGLFKAKTAEIMPENEFLLNNFIETFKIMDSEKEIIKALQNDKEGIIQTYRFIAKRTDKSPYYGDFEDNQIA
ncbi:SAM-dependent methyltransferase [Bacteroidota bacterium]